MRVLIIALLTLVAALAGCTDSGDADDDTSGDDIGDQNDPIEETEDNGDAGNTTGGPDDDDQDDGAVEGNNMPPTATISASIEQGAIPFNVTFDLDGSDADGDDLSWTLDADGDGTMETEGIALPANFTYTYDAEGLYNVSLAVMDGTTTTWQNLTINATAAAAAANELAVLLLSGHVYAPDPTSYTHTNCLQGLLTQPDGAPGSTWFDLPSETWGGTYSIDVEGIEVRFADDSSAEVYESGTSGQVPEGANVVEACSMEAVDTDFTITIEYDAP